MKSFEIDLSLALVHTMSCNYTFQSHVWSFTALR